MLRITRKVEYALIALRHLQQAEKGQLASAKSMASIYGIPQELLAKILQRLSKQNIQGASQNRRADEAAREQNAGYCSRLSACWPKLA